MCEQWLHEAEYDSGSLVEAGLVTHTRIFYGDDQTEHALCTIGRGWVRRTAAELWCPARQHREHLRLS
jgi:hypothetical protein